MFALIKKSSGQYTLFLNWSACNIFYAGALKSKNQGQMLRYKESQC